MKITPFHPIDSLLELPPADVMAPTLVLHLARCCALPEPELRSYIRDWLSRLGFTIRRDSYRGGANGSISNLLTVRGEPRVMLVAHSDTIWEQDDQSRPPKPIVLERAGRWVMEDDGTEVQLGADDRLGIAQATWLAAIRPELPLALLVTTDEETGCRSARQAPEAWFTGIDLAVQLDRRSDYGDQLVTEIGETQLCSDEMAQWMLKIAGDLGLPREPVTGGSTDVCRLIERGVVREAVNLTCGYHKPHCQHEYIDLAEAQETVTYLEAIALGFGS